jgi:general nucleoside transport system ATP-binding protein
VKRIRKLEMKGIGKKFPGVTANRDIDVTIEKGEILGLLGENGAGKTTLMNILYGLYRQDDGEIYINGERVVFTTPKDSMQAGIGMIHQHFMLVQKHTVVENISLGLDETPFFFPVRKLRGKIEEFSKQFGLYVDPDKFIWELSAGEQQRVEILKALFARADLLIMDEPTSVLTPQEAEDLFGILRKMAADGHSVILISHKLEEILSICDRVLVLRKGAVTGSSAIGDVDRRKLARMMVGRDIEFQFEKAKLPPGPAVLSVEGLEVQNDQGLPAVRGINIEIRRNRIVGIAGVSGNGQRELVEAITGLRKASGGTVILGGKDITNAGAGKVHKNGITHVPEERIKFGTVPNLFLYENAVLKQQNQSVFSRRLFLKYPAIKKYAAGLVEKFNVSTPSISTPVKNLSGGNIQKLILGREMSASPLLLIAAHPTYGLDVGAAEYIRQQLLDLREAGGAVLLVSEDLEELFQMCDEIAVMYEGKIMGIVTPGSCSMETVGLMMAGTDGETEKE